jgi:hypothetical protein
VTGGSTVNNRLETYFVHTSIHAASVSYIFYQIMTRSFSFQPSPTRHVYQIYMLITARGMVETKKTSYCRMRDKRPGFNVCICALRYHVH